jgi:hypothetical protein
MWKIRWGCLQRPNKRRRVTNRTSHDLCCLAVPVSGSHRQNGGVGCGKIHFTRGREAVDLFYHESTITTEFKINHGRKFRHKWTSLVCILWFLLFRLHYCLTMLIQLYAYTAIPAIYRHMFTNRRIYFAKVKIQYRYYKLYSSSYIQVCLQWFKVIMDVWSSAFLFSHYSMKRTCGQMDYFNFLLWYVYHIPENYKHLATQMRTPQSAEL